MRVLRIRELRGASKGPCVFRTGSHRPFQLHERPRGRCGLPMKRWTLQACSGCACAFRIGLSRTASGCIYRAVHYGSVGPGHVGGLTFEVMGTKWLRSATTAASTSRSRVFRRSRSPNMTPESRNILDQGTSDLRRRCSS